MYQKMQGETVFSRTHDSLARAGANLCHKRMATRAEVLTRVHVRQGHLLFVGVTDIDQSSPDLQESRRSLLLLQCSF